MEFWNELITDKSFKVLRELRKRYSFTLIGGWAVFMFTKSIKSKDIDIIVDFETLSQMRKELEISKTEFLKKYQSEIEGVSIDIYVPYYSEFVVPAEGIVKNTINVEGFNLPKPEILLLLKLQAEKERTESVKGQKDRADILSLLISEKIDFKNFKNLVEKYKLENYNRRLKNIVRTARKEFEYLGITDLRKVKKIRERLLEQTSYVANNL